MHIRLYMLSESQEFFHACVPWLANKIPELGVARESLVCVMTLHYFCSARQSLSTICPAI